MAKAISVLEETLSEPDAQVTLKPEHITALILGFKGFWSTNRHIGLKAGLGLSTTH